jgi:hypothetical protein
MMTGFEGTTPNTTLDITGNLMRTILVYSDGPERLITRSGHAFQLPSPDEQSAKRFIEGTPPMVSMKPDSIRKWYNQFTEHARQYGIYIHPYYCFRKSTGSSRGFTCGDDSDINRYDLPAHLFNKLNYWSGKIFLALRKEGILPKDTDLKSNAIRSYGAGYEGLYSIIECDLYPSTLLRNRPRKENLSLSNSVALKSAEPTLYDGTCSPAATLPTLAVPVSVTPTLITDTYQVIRPGPTEIPINSIDLFSSESHSIGSTSIPTDITFAPYEFDSNNPLSSSTPRVTLNTLRGACLVSIDGDCIFTSAARTPKLKTIYNQGVCQEIPIVFAPEKNRTHFIPTEIALTPYEYDEADPDPAFDRDNPLGEIPQYSIFTSPVSSLYATICSPAAILPTLVAPVSVPPTLHTETYQVTHPGPTDTQINWIDLFPAEFNNIGRTSVHTYITLEPYDFDCKNPDPAFDRDNPLSYVTRRASRNTLRGACLVSIDCDRIFTSGLEQQDPTPIYEDNLSAINIVNFSKPTERPRDINIRFSAIQDWKARVDIVLKHIPGVINAADDLTKPLGWVLHSRYARYIMGHFNYLK